MNKISVLVVFSIFFFIGCSGTAGNDSSSTGTTTTESGYGRVTCTIVKETNGIRSISADTDTVYVSVWNDGQFTSKAVDVSNQTSVDATITVPVGTYSVQAFATQYLNNLHFISTYGYVTNISVSEGKNTTVSLALTKPVVTPSFQDSTYTDVTYLTSNSTFTALLSTSSFPFKGYRTFGSTLYSIYRFIDFYKDNILQFTLNMDYGSVVFTAPTVTTDTTYTIKPGIKFDNIDGNDLYFYLDESTIQVKYVNGNLAVLIK